MNNFEALAASRPQLNIIISKKLPKFLGGLTFIRDIYINHNLTEREKYEVLQEEFAHYDYTVGDIASGDSEADKNNSLPEVSKRIGIALPTLKAYRSDPDKLRTAAWERVHALAGEYDAKH